MSAIPPTVPGGRIRHPPLFAACAAAHCRMDRTTTGRSPAPDVDHDRRGHRTAPLPRLPPIQPGAPSGRPGVSTRVTPLPPSQLPEGRCPLNSPRPRRLGEATAAHNLASHAPNAGLALHRQV